MVASVQRAAQSRVRHINAHDGVRLHAEIFGDDDAPAVVFAHGFGQTRHAWTSTAHAMAAQGYCAVTADGRGHGDSGWLSGGEYTFEQFVDDARLLTLTAGTRPVWVGASMGGLLGMVAETGASNGLFSALVLVDITPRWETRGVERILGFMRAHPQGFADVDEAQDAVRSYLPHRANGKDPSRLEKLLVRMDNGRLRWHWDPRLLDTVATQTQHWSERLADAARSLKLPVLLVSGGRSDVVSSRTIDEFQKLVPHAEHQQLAEATHMVAGDANDRFTTSIADFLHRLGHAPLRQAN